MMKSIPPALAFAVFMSLSVSQARADGDCTVRAPTAAEKQAYTAAFDLFVRVAPRAPDGWTYTDHPATAAIPTLCQESGNEPIRRGFNRDFRIEQGRQERDDQAMQAYTDMATKQQAKAEANRAAVEAIDAQINELIAQVQVAAAAQRFDEIEPLNLKMDALGKKKASLMGLDETEQQAAAIEADLTRDADASFRLWFETPRQEPRTGAPYRTSAGRALVIAYDDKGNPRHDVSIHFGGAPQQARVIVSGAPERVRALVDATDLQEIAAFR